MSDRIHPDEVELLSRAATLAQAASAMGVPERKLRRYLSSRLEVVWSAADLVRNRLLLAQQALIRDWTQLDNWAVHERLSSICAARNVWVWNRRNLQTEEGSVRGRAAQ